MIVKCDAMPMFMAREEKVQLNIAQTCCLWPIFVEASFPKMNLDVKSLNMFLFIIWLHILLGESMIKYANKGFFFFFF
jgi:hypothetical protein